MLSVSSTVAGYLGLGTWGTGSLATSSFCCTVGAIVPTQLPAAARFFCTPQLPRWCTKQLPWSSHPSYTTALTGSEYSTCITCTLYIYLGTNFLMSLEAFPHIQNLPEDRDYCLPPPPPPITDFPGQLYWNFKIKGGGLYGQKQAFCRSKM